MRRSELPLAVPGLYLIDGPPGDPMGLVLCGPIPATVEGQRTADILATQYEARLGKIVSWSEVTELPEPIDLRPPESAPMVSVVGAPSALVAAMEAIKIDDAPVDDAPAAAPVVSEGFADNWRGGAS